MKMIHGKKTGSKHFDYQPGVLNERLNAAFPARGEFFLYWQYPPTYYFVVAPLAALSYPTAFWSWAVVTTGAALAALRSLWNAWLPLLVVFASGAAWQGLITGQTGFLTAALITVAGGWADRRPLVAGIAAGGLPRVGRPPPTLRERAAQRARRRRCLGKASRRLNDLYLMLLAPSGQKG